MVRNVPVIPPALSLSTLPTLRAQLGHSRLYYTPRWKLFFAELIAALRRGVPFAQALFDEKVFRLVEEPFGRLGKDGAALNAEAAEGPPLDPVVVVKGVFSKYWPTCRAVEKLVRRVERRRNATRP